jgi:flagellar biosynthetic protein FlhB
MSDESDDGEKPYEATDRKLEEARKQGQFPFSADLVTASSYAGFAIFATVMGGGALVAAGEVFQATLAEGLRAGPDFQIAMTELRGALLALALPVAGWFAVPALMALLGVIGQGGPVFAPPRMAPAWHKISPISTLQQKFGLAGLVEFGKGLVKATLFGVVLGYYLQGALPGVVAASTLDARQVVVLLLDATVDVVALTTAVALGVGVFDLFWQRFNHSRRQRMSRKEMEDEMREAEGDPMLKSQRRQAGIAIAFNQAAAAVPKADVVIVNPTHYAVALSWDRAGGRAPVCVAKGTDDVALHIRKLAAQHGVPVRSDPPTARALHASVAVGQEVPRAHFRAVAAAIRFADRIRSRKVQE